MASLTKSPAASFLDLPPEVRIEIYKYAFPTEILLKAWQWKGSKDTDTFSGFVEVKLARNQRPGFMLANRLVYGESDSIFWSRVVLDCTLVETENWKSTSLTLIPGSEALNSIYVSDYQADQIQCLKLSAQCDGATKDWLHPFRNLNAIELYIPGGWVLERDLRAACSILRNRANGRKVQYDLELWMREYFQGLPNNNFFSNDIVRSIPGLAEQYDLQIQLAPRRITQSWTRLVAFGTVEEVKYEVTAHVTYDWSQDLVSCNFEDAEKTTKSRADIDEDAYNFDMSRVPTERPTPYPYEYRSPRELMAVKGAPLIDKLIFRELENRGMTPILDNREMRRLFHFP